MPLDDDTFLARFETLDLGAEHFDHRGHLRMAWLHLRRHEPAEANRRVCGGIRALATKLGAPDKYNHTLTEALMRIMAVRMARAPRHDFERFLDANHDLCDDAVGLLARHYSDTRLNSPEAHRTWVEPDRAPIE